ncbi:DUF2483 family protein [Staphylococcus simulans]|uniref:DUF2483 family protein n=1 Tax=Staphylococcus simulans TaxID=1286 RepID=UPI000D1E2698|nr:DUF2483 family protein [Staphylococcus simulans]PTJ09054.1 hypothetical protein BU044_11305 [Staphylococcus simulans]PTJ41125.1 hypothetical protein BU021_03090 [Staphylococcus simulans]
MSKTTVTYLIKITDSNLYVTNKPTDKNTTIKYSTDRRDAREFNGMEDAAVDMTFHTAIKKTVTETTEYEEVAYDARNELISENS